MKDALKLKKIEIPWKQPIDAINKKAEKLKRLHRLLIFFGAVVLICAGFIFLVYMPKAEAINQTEKEITTLEDKIRIGKIRARNLPVLKAKRVEINKKLLAALKLLPDEREIPSLLKEITELGKESGLEFKLFVPESEVIQDFYAEIPVAIEVEGDYRNVARFFYKVSRMKRVVNIVNVTIRPKDSFSVMLITRCKAITYRFQENSKNLCETCRKPAIGYCTKRERYVCETHRYFTDSSGKKWKCP